MQDPLAVKLSVEGLPEIFRQLGRVRLALASAELRSLMVADPEWSEERLDELAARCQAMPYLELGDLAFLRTLMKGPIGRWLVAFLIRVATHTRKDKRPSLVNHVAIVIAPVVDHRGRIVDYVIAEALGKGGFQYRRLLECYGDQARYDYAIARLRDLTEPERAAILAACEYLLGKAYAFAMIAAHFIDYGLTKILDLFGARGDVYLARRLCKMERYAMCSWSATFAFDQAGRPFLVPIKKASPDDVWDEVRDRKGPAPHLFMWSWMYATGILRTCLIDRAGGP